MWSCTKSALCRGLLIAALSMGCLGQGGSFVRQVVSGTISNGGTGQVIPNAIVRVCPSTGSGSPCSPLSSIYADQALTQPLANPFSADSNGLYSFFIATGEYFVQESAPIGAGYSFSESFLIFSNGTGTVSSVGLQVPTDIFTVTGTNPVTTSGILSFGTNAQSPYYVWANCTASSAVPSFCPISASMLPSTFNSLTIGTLTVTGNQTVGGTLGVTGLTTLSGLNVTGGSTLGSLNVTGATILDSTLNVTGNIVTNGAIAAAGTGLSSFNGPISSPYFNASTGYQIGGTYGTANYFLQSTGSGTTFSPVYYQSVASNGSISSQKPILNFTQRFTVTPVSSPSESTVDANTPGSGNLLATYLSSPGGSTALAVFDGAGNLAPGPSQSNNYVVAASSGQVIQAGKLSCGGSSCSGSFTHIFSSAPICTVSGDNGSVALNGEPTTSAVNISSSGVTYAHWICVGAY